MVGVKFGRKHVVVFKRRTVLIRFQKYVFYSAQYRLSVDYFSLQQSLIKPSSVNSTLF